MLQIDDVTRKWILNKSDELAVERAGCRFDVKRAKHVLDFFPSCLELFEGGRKTFVPIPAAQKMLARVFGWVRQDPVSGKWKRRFKSAYWWVPKKNAKTPIAAGVGLYLLTQDGEPGQKVYTAAKDGKQAKIVHRHAMKMGERSPVLRPYLKFNKTENIIEYPDEDGYYFLIAGDNPNSQEGLNGSCIIDELHVVNWELYSVLEYMGASRPEPLMFHCSTAGKDLEGIGKAKYDYGKQVAAGEVYDHTVFFESYELPAGISDEQLKIPLDCSPEEELKRLQPWIQANPGWGITLDTEDFISKLKAAQRSPQAFARFKMYRGNQWQSGDSPLISMSDWRECQLVFDVDHMTAS